MSFSLIGGVAALLFLTAVLGLTVWGASWAVVRVIDARSRLMRRHIAHGMVVLRRLNFQDRGLLLRKPRLWKQVYGEARMFSAQIQPLGGSAGWTSAWDAWLELARDPAALKKVVRKVWGDILEPGDVETDTETPARLHAIFDGMTEAVSRQFRNIQFLLSLVLGVVLASLLGTNLWAILSAISSGRFSFQLPASPPFLPWNAPLDWSLATGVVAAGIIWALGAVAWDVAIARYSPSEPVGAPATAPSTASEESKPRDEGKIGEDGLPVLILNFAGGAFDTVMQLGVAHAITVIQGRAPDAVVGVSAGALNAAALAEILQAGEAEEYRLCGEDPERPVRTPAARWEWAGATPDLRETIQRTRLAARAVKLRFYIEQAQMGPGEVLDSLFPDAYQIESSDPLASLRRPRFSNEERCQRDDAATARSGLVRLYNDLLDVNFSIGTITRFVRRVLGLRAAGDFPGMKRYSAYLVEFVHLLMLFGVNLIRVASLVSSIFITLVWKHGTPTTAGALMSRYGPLRQLLKYSLNVISFAFLLVLWLFFALTPFVGLDLLRVTYGLGVTCGLGLALLVGSAIFVSVVEQNPWFDSILELGEGWIAYVWFTAQWLAPAVMVAVMVRWIQGPGMSGAEIGPLTVETARIVWKWGFGGVVLAALFFWWVRRRGHSPDRLLKAYHLEASLFQSHGFRQFLIKLFHRGYYGKSSMDGVVEDSLLGKPEGSHRVKEPKYVGYYSCANRLAPIHLGLAVANVATGKIEVLAPHVKLIDALMAAVAATPLFPPAEIDGKLYIDGSNICDDPMQALWFLLRRRLNRNSQVVHIYSASPFPVSRCELGKEPNQQEYDSLIDVAFRALRLQRFRDATMERRLTELITRVIPKDDLTATVDVKYDGRNYNGTFFRAWVTPIELDSVRSVNKEVFKASTKDRRTAIRETIADGCRAAMQVMIHHSVAQCSSVEDGSGLLASCSSAVSHHLNQQLTQPGSPPELIQLQVPGKHSLGPGLEEVCQHCRLRRGPEGESAPAQALQFRQWTKKGPAWPHERNYSRKPLVDDPHFTTEEPKPPSRSFKDRKWPVREGRDIQRDKRPIISFLFSGGVFRGVYQMGVLNALNELNLQPDLIAGASVGSITAAMVAKTFSLPSGDFRNGQIARLAAVYVAIDRLVLTDRFADFIRDLTLRAGNTGFSIRQADQFFRKFDYPSLLAFDRNARCVLAGIERLFWVSPFQANRLSRSIREGDWTSAWGDLGNFLENFLSQMRVGDEVLGADPLEQLIDEYVTKDIETKYPKGPTFEDLEKHTDSRILFFATTTDLTDGKLDVIGEQGRSPAILKEGLLASSAFPGVFRPRWSWELRPEDCGRRQYIDGGVMDNLPIDTVTSFIAAVAKDREEADFTHPDTPHLVVAVSLEPALRRSLAVCELDHLRKSWPELRGRAGKLGYNAKLDSYTWAEAILSHLHRKHRERGTGTTEIDPVDIHVLPIKPEWLCSTFGFHPMLGFRRDRQKRSIAHGCASTLLRFAQVDESNRKGWGIDQTAVPKSKRWAEAFKIVESGRSPAEDGYCWLRPKKPCPFSPDQLKGVKPALPEDTQKELGDIWRLCRDHKTQFQEL